MKGNDKDVRKIQKEKSKFLGEYSRRNKLEVVPSSRLNEDLTGKVSLTTHPMAEKIAGLPKPEMVHGCQAVGMNE